MLRIWIEGYYCYEGFECRIRPIKRTQGVSTKYQEHRGVYIGQLFKSTRIFSDSKGLSDSVKSETRRGTEPVPPRQDDFCRVL